MNQYSSFIRSRNLFNSPPVGYETFGNFNLAPLGVEKYAYNTYRHYIKDYITNPKDDIVFDVNCGKGWGLCYLKKEYDFKKCIGYNSVPELLKECKEKHPDINFYKDFIMSKQKNANFIFSIEAFNNYDNKSALLLKFKQSLADNGKLIIVQSSTNEKEYRNFEMILEKTHGLKPLQKLEIAQDVFQAVDLIADGPVQTTCIEYSKYQSAYNMNNDYKIFVSIYQNV